MESKTIINDYLIPITVSIKYEKIVEKSDVDVIRQKLNKELEKLKSRYKHTPIILLGELGEQTNIIDSFDMKKYNEITIFINEDGNIELREHGISEGDVFGLEEGYMWEKEFKGALKRIDVYNADVIRLLPKLKDEIHKSKSYILEKEDREKLTPSLEKTLNHFAASDVLSMYFQKWRLRTLISVYTLGFFVVAFFLFYHLLESKIMLIIYALVYALAYLVYYSSKKKEMEIKYLDYRSLCEGLRVQFFWHYAGIGEDVTNNYLYEQKDELGWIENSIRVLNINSENIKENAQKYEKLLKYWVDDQLKFFTSRIEKNEKAMRKHKMAIKILLCATVFVGILLIYFEFFTKLCEKPMDLLSILPENFKKTIFPKHEEIFVKNWMLITFEIVAAIAGFTESYVENTAISHQVKRYLRISSIYSKASKYLTLALKTEDNDMAKRVIKILGKETLIENGDWLLLFRERPIEIPK